MSMTDMMVGMLFLFLILLMFFAMKFNEASARKTVAVESLTRAKEARDQILQEIKKAMEREKVNVLIDPDDGIVRLPEATLFEHRKSELSSLGEHAVASLAKVLYQVLPCHTATASSNCGKVRHPIESVLVEGHTDATGTEARNWELSLQRSLKTFELLQKTRPELVTLKNSTGQMLIGLAGYGRNRLLIKTEKEEAQNRRIDIRFIMHVPRVIELEELERRGTL
ncbi:MAG: OmpA family protein [Magnetococcus sp. XQGC-1]